MKTRIVWTKIWEDDWFDRLSREARLLFLYLLTNPQIGLTGCYEIRDKTIRYHTHLSTSEVTLAKKELKSKAIFFKGWVYLKNAVGYNGFTGKSNAVAKSREMTLIPVNVKTALFKEEGYTPPTSSLQSINHNKKSEIRNKGYKKCLREIGKIKRP